MLRIRRSEVAGFTVFALSGRIEEADVLELQGLLDAEATPMTVAVDLAEVRLVDREAVRFLAVAKDHGIELRNCPAYIREWIHKGSDTRHEQ